MSATTSQFVKCICQNCPGHIEFDVAHKGATVTCPHCGLDTRLYIPSSPLPQRSVAADASQKRPATQQKPQPSAVKTPPSKAKSEPPLYYYKVGTGEKGPYTAAQLRSIWASGQVTADTVYRSSEAPGWAPLSESPVISTGQSALAGMLAVVAPLGRFHDRSVQAVCLLSLAVFFLPNATAKVPVIGTVSHSMLSIVAGIKSALMEMDWQSVATAATPRAGAFSFQDFVALLLPVAFLGLLAHYALTPFLAIVAIGFRRAVPRVLVTVWLALAAQFPPLFLAGAWGFLSKFKSDALSSQDGGIGGLLAFAMANNASYSPGFATWILMVAALFVVAVPIIARRHGLPWFADGSPLAKRHGPGILALLWPKHTPTPKSKLVLIGGGLCMACLLLVLFHRRASAGAGGREDRGTAPARAASQGIVSIAVAGVSVGQVCYRDALGRPEFAGPYLTVSLCVSNFSTSKKVDFQTWRGSDFRPGSGAATLRDDLGNTYKRIAVTPAPNLLDPAPDSASLHPRMVFYDCVVFEVPLQNATSLRLELPAKNFGGRGVVRLEVPANPAN